mgnify:FL=1
MELLYHHFKNMATQVVTHKTYLPLSLSDTEAAETATDYILEPSAEELRNRLFPKLLNLTIYTILLDTSTAEHAARMMAMQTANDNANDLIQQLTCNIIKPASRPSPTNCWISWEERPFHRNKNGMLP